MSRLLKFATAAVVIAFVTGAILYFYLPVNRVGVTSELIMLGDLNGDNKWDGKDGTRLQAVLANPFIFDNLTLMRIDINRNELVDGEDLTFLQQVYEFSDPYEAEQRSRTDGLHYPKPRELFRYLPKHEYLRSPLFWLDHNIAHMAPFAFLRGFQFNPNASHYEQQLFQEIYNEAIRFSLAYAVRKDGLADVEADYVLRKTGYCDDLWEQGRYYDLLLGLISLVEDAETLSITTQTDFIKKILYFRDNLKALLVSPEFESFERGESSHSAVFRMMEDYLMSDLNMGLHLDSLSPPRDFLELQNYLDRAEWQAYKSKTTPDDFKQLVDYGQYDRRYLRAVSNTTPKLTDIQLRNHNLPMILLYREALRITGGDKKAAVGLLDEVVRIPLGWVKGIPKDRLPSSVALENFLLPGNKEDGSDKSRHWNVFGGVAIYKSPVESLELSLKREIMDLKDKNYAPSAMREFIRDTIANINGIYYVISINPELLSELEDS